VLVLGQVEAKCRFQFSCFQFRPGGQLASGCEFAKGQERSVVRFVLHYELRIDVDALLILLSGMSGNVTPTSRWQDGAGIINPEVPGE